MLEQTQRSGQKQQKAANRPHKTNEPILIEVLVREPQHDSAVYTWDTERASLRLTGVYHARPGLPADVAILQLEGQAELPVLLLHRLSIAPETRVQARLLGALSPGQPAQHEGTRPSESWVFIAAAHVDGSLSAYSSLETLPPAQRDALNAYIQEQARGEQGQPPDGIPTGTTLPSPSAQPAGAADSVAIETCNAEAAARLIRATRLSLRREQRARPRRKAWRGGEEDEKPVAWRAVEGLAESLRLAVQRDAKLAQNEDAPHAQAEHLIRFVPQRFQHALARLLLDDERLLAFVERPLLQHHTGLLGMQTRRSNEGLLLVTDRQALWLRDFLTPGSTFSEGSYIARTVQLERLQRITVLPPGRTVGEFAGRLDANDSPYQRLVLEVASAGGTELMAIEFAQKTEIEKALARIAAILRAFLPQANGNTDRRVRRLPVVEMWMPQGAEASRLAGSGGFIPAPIAERLRSAACRKCQGSGRGGPGLCAGARAGRLQDPGASCRADPPGAAGHRWERGEDGDGAGAALCPPRSFLGAAALFPAGVRSQHLCTATGWPHPAVVFPVQQPGDRLVLAPLYAPALALERAVPCKLRDKGELYERCQRRAAGNEPIRFPAQREPPACADDDADAP